MKELFVAKLTGAQQVPPVYTKATGTAVFKAKDNKKIYYRLEVNHLRNFTEAHIHRGKKGENGPIVVYLFGPAKPGISVNKGIVEGTITECDVVGPLSGKPLSTLIHLMKEKKTYVNAHTKQHPNGEIRGQIKPYHPEY